MERGGPKRPEPLTSEFERLSQRLRALGLFPDDALLLLAGDGVKVVFDAQGRPVRSALFEHLHAPLALFSHGPASSEFSQLGRPLCASTDDMAQLFGPRIPCLGRPRAKTPACLVRGRGFVVCGRYPEELVAAAILMEKACRGELLAPKIGRPHYLNPALCQIEHAVYLASYSRHEKEAARG